MHRAFDLGCNFVDTAQNYGDGYGEAVVCRAVREWTGHGRIFVATKIPPSPGDWPPSPYDPIEARFSRDYLRERIERSLRDLGRECIDRVQVHTWARAWNRNPAVFDMLRDFRNAGKVLGIGVSTPEHDQNAVMGLMRAGWVDSVQVIYSISEQEPQAELLPAAGDHKVGVIARLALDESALTGKLTPGTHFADGDIRNRYFAGDRLAKTVRRVEAIRRTLGDQEPELVTAALKFALKPLAVSTVIPGIRTQRQAETNLAVSDQEPMTDSLEEQLRAHMWRRGFWYAGK